jgi:hypothetical protein
VVSDQGIVSRQLSVAGKQVQGPKSFDCGWVSQTCCKWFPSVEICAFAQGRRIADLGNAGCHALEESGAACIALALKAAEDCAHSKTLARVIYPMSAHNAIKALYANNACRRISNLRFEIAKKRAGSPPPLRFGATRETGSEA